MKKQIRNNPHIFIVDIVIVVVAVVVDVARVVIIVRRAKPPVTAGVVRIVFFYSEFLRFLSLEIHFPKNNKHSA